MKTKTSTFLCLLIFCAFFFPVDKLHAQSETHNVITYDTTFNVGYASLSYIFHITRPKNMFVAGDPDAAARPAIIMMNGVGEVGTNAGMTSRYGPHYWLTHGWDGGVVLSNGTHYPILITVQPSQAWPGTTELVMVVKYLIKTYHINPNAVHLTGLSMGAMSWAAMICHQTTPGAEDGMKLVTSLTCLEGVNNGAGVSPGVVANSLPFCNSFGRWAKKYKGRFFGLEGTADWRNVATVSKNMNDSVPGSAFFSYESLGGGAHCCWNSMYDPSATNWTSVGTLGPNNANGTDPNSMGTYKAPQSIFQWMLMQGDYSLVGATGSAPVVNAGSNVTIIFPQTSTTLSGSATDPDGSISSYTWTKVSGPSQYSLATPGSSSTVVSNLTVGLYTFELTATDNSGMSANSTVQVLSTVTLPVVYLGFSGEDNAGVNYLTWQTSDEDGKFDVERSVNGTDFIPVGTLDAKTGSGTHTYSYIDAGAADGISYYRIKNSSLSGEALYSKVIQISKNEGKGAMSFYPNPARDYVVVNLQSKEKGATIIQLLDMNGRVVSQQQGNKTDDYFSGKINLNNVSPGLYIVYCRIGDHVHHLGKVIRD